MLNKKRNNTILIPRWIMKVFALSFWRVVVFLQPESRAGGHTVELVSWFPSQCAFGSAKVSLSP